MKKSGRKAKNSSRKAKATGKTSSSQARRPRPSSTTRKPRILWANSYCLLDTSSGASISVRQILHQLCRSGYEVEIVGATVFDHPRGIEGLGSHWQTIKDAQNNDPNTIANVTDGSLKHRLVATKSTVRSEIKLSESNTLYQTYINRLDEFKPDLVFFYGGQLWDFFIPHEARMRGVPSVAYLVNANYQGKRWCRDVDLIITDTQATSNMYIEQQGFKPVPVGKFIDLGKVIAPDHKRQYATLINPSWTKGAGIVAMLAVLLEERRPDIVFEVVESRGSWSEVVRNVTRSVWGGERSELSNVIVTPNTDNISEVYGRSRIVLGLSQWWESGSRVLAEAMLNGIPAMVSNAGGSPEMVGEGGIVVDLPQSCHEAPYNSMPRPELLGELVQFLERVWDDEPFYLNLMVRALQQGNKLHRMEVSTQRLLEAFQPLIEKRAGDGDFSDAVKRVHKHGLEEVKGSVNLTYGSSKPDSDSLNVTPSSLPRAATVRSAHRLAAFSANFIQESVVEKITLELSRGDCAVTLIFESVEDFVECRPSSSFLAKFNSNTGTLWRGTQEINKSTEELSRTDINIVSGINAQVWSTGPLPKSKIKAAVKRMNAFKCSAIHKRVGYVLFGNETCASARLRGSYISAWLDTQPGFDSEVLFQPDVRYAANLSEKETAFLCVRIILGNFSAIVFQKVSSAGHRQVMRLCRKLGVRVVYDDCDPRLDFSHASLVDKVTVASPALAQELYSSFNVCSEVIEDTIDFSPPIKVQFDPANSWRGVWIGTSDKFDYFRAYRDKMHTVAPELVVTAISDHAEADIEWGLELFPTIFSKFGFGLVTLEDTEWSRTKSPNRATLMMANGLPVICENHLAYANVIDHGKSGFLATTPEEAATFAGALADADRWNLIASVGAKSVSERYGLDTIGPLWAAVILDNLT